MKRARLTIFSVLEGGLWLIANVLVNQNCDMMKIMQKSVKFVIKDSVTPITIVPHGYQSKMMLLTIMIQELMPSVALLMTFLYKGWLLSSDGTFGDQWVCFIQVASATRQNGNKKGKKSVGTFSLTSNK